MSQSFFITGGARSGKSELAERLTLAFAQPAFYIATAQALDPEMEARIARHKARRGDLWQTVAAPIKLGEALGETDGDSPRLVDCLALWLSNMILADQDWETAVDRLAETIPRQSSPVVFVTNEVGAGIVPESALARTFRDAAGLMNQRIATVCDKFYLYVAGYPIEVK
ncbi:bifunctional adenosylcobinamide kinase/adenosylcobinamide-phosphate guanylyltransferase [Ruegeria sp. 2012CJ41-6]|uniref:Bifunctional adenosylcobalamin biosynthesis protein n=1 Tax=Ruegeria spongiae TaxID=2942209 RepID=A0ABT0Q838_9RHOB|nr:bifunctional adenosylcobinamide kinase/adenosylcobinamide-phosphate guanylyltransferase [Ruegeria spongiae]MCL6285975.1 bifunctional adenosylcobinamide kinase/adenosylcobinamide-phosphate guanylyltransferase [Ruegeria spongiae]